LIIILFYYYDSIKKSFNISIINTFISLFSNQSIGIPLNVGKTVLTVPVTGLIIVLVYFTAADDVVVDLLACHQ